MLRFSEVPESARRGVPLSPEARASVRDVPSIGGSPEVRGASSLSSPPSPFDDGGSRRGSAHRMRKLRPVFQLGGSPEVEASGRQVTDHVRAGADPFFLTAAALESGVLTLPDESARIQKPPPAKVRFRNPFALRARPKKTSVPPTPKIGPHEQFFEGLSYRMEKALLDGAKKRLKDLQEDTARDKTYRDMGFTGALIRNHPVAAGPVFVSGLGYIRLSASAANYADGRMTLHGPEFDDTFASPLAPELQYCTPRSLERFDVREVCMDAATEDLVWVPSVAFDAFVDKVYQLNTFAEQNNIKNLRIALNCRGEGYNLHSHHGRCYEIDSFWLRAACPDITDTFE